MSYYVGILDGRGDAWGVRIADCPGAFGGGASADEAVRSAAQGLALWWQAVRRDGATPRPPRSLDAILADAEDRPSAEAGEVAVLIPLIPEADLALDLAISLDPGLLVEIDAEAERRGLTRSRLIAEAAREKVIG